MVTSLNRLSLKFVVTSLLIAYYEIIRLCLINNPSVSNRSRPRLVSIINMTCHPVPSAEKRDRRNTRVLVAGISAGKKADDDQGEMAESAKTVGETLNADIY